MNANMINLVVAKLIDADDVAVGSHDVDAVVTIRVNAKVTRLPDHNYTPTVAVPLKAALALVLEKAGVTGEHAARMLVEAMTEALAIDEKSAEGAIKERLNAVETAMETVAKVTKALPKKTRKGATSVKGTLEILDIDAGNGLVACEEEVLAVAE